MANAERDMIVFSTKQWEGEYWSRDIPNGVEIIPQADRNMDRTMSKYRIFFMDSVLLTATDAYHTPIVPPEA